MLLCRGQNPKSVTIAAFNTVWSAAVIANLPSRLCLAKCVTKNLFFCPKPIKNISMIHTVAVHGMFLHYTLTLVYFEPIPHTMSWCCQYSIENQMCIKPLLNIFPSKCTIYSSLSNITVNSAFAGETVPSYFRKLLSLRKINHIFVTERDGVGKSEGIEGSLTEHWDCYQWDSEILSRMSCLSHWSVSLKAVQHNALVLLIS